MKLFEKRTKKYKKVDTKPMTSKELQTHIRMMVTAMIAEEEMVQTIKRKKDWPSVWQVMEFAYHLLNLLLQWRKKIKKEAQNG
jgi:hypothetical protein